ncbi:uncharacterized protein LOC100898652 [Galendromus occidentalis]|uniref:Uncharacterized protein LOC100898652 n=1 Tax=Galendromus occidentalis TaxID=34638 RepID=A0AAJ6QUC7_9ACAR|nr:uncharacterized protein LOC100898652 [Galendromus occidentalis]
MEMTDEIVTRAVGASSVSELDDPVLENLVEIIDAFNETWTDLIESYIDATDDDDDSEGASSSAIDDFADVLTGAVSAIQQLYISHPDNAQLRLLSTMMSRGRQLSESGRFSRRNRHLPRRNTSAAEIRSSRSSCAIEDDDDNSDFETISSSRTYSVNDVDESEQGTDHESRSDGNSSFEMESDLYYYSYLSMSDLASDGASIHSCDSSSDDDDFSDEEFMDESEDWTIPTRLAKTCHVLQEKVVRQMLRKDYEPQWYDVVDLVLESDEQSSKGPAEPDCLDDYKIIQDPARDFSKLINKQLLRNERAHIISLVQTAPESTRLEITANTLFLPRNLEHSDEDRLDMG